MPVHTLPAANALQQLDTFDTIIDARSEDEFALDHLSGAINWPTLDNAERIAIGTMYKQVNAFEAKKRGAAIAARNISAHIEREVIDKPRGWKPLVYCWRGGNRSGSLATILGAIGFHVTLVEGGYKAWRAALVDDLPRLAQRLQYRVVCGPTGSGKTRLLQALAAQGAQVLDLEALANHRSSVLGHMPGLPQPSQKGFDSLVWEALRQFDAAQVVYVEAESKKVGNVRVPRTRGAAAGGLRFLRQGPGAFLRPPASAGGVARQRRGEWLDRESRPGANARSGAGDPQAALRPDVRRLHQAQFQPVWAGTPLFIAQPFPCGHGRRGP